VFCKDVQHLSPACLDALLPTVRLIDSSFTFFSVHLYYFPSLIYSHKELFPEPEDRSRGTL